MGQSVEFGKFLKAMRSRLSPEQAGINTTSGARRVPGLRREEIARLADVSTDYYTRLEQGRNISHGVEKLQQRGPDALCR